MEKRVSPVITKQLALSNDGTVCAIGGGHGNPLYLIALESKTQHKLTSDVLKATFAPCFINGDTEFVAVGGSGKMEVWDIKNKKPVKVLDGEGSATASTNNILAVGRAGVLELWDVRNWEMFYSSDFEGLDPKSLHLTSDSKYLTIAGKEGGDKCVVLEIK